MNCIDLRTTCQAKRWRWRYEESFKAERDPAERAQKAWYVEVLCRHGLIYPWGGEDLLAYTKGPVIRGKLAGLGLARHQSGHAEAVFRFPAGRLDEVAAVLRPRLRRAGRPASPEALAALKRLHAEQAARRSQGPPPGPG